VRPQEEEHEQSDLPTPQSRARVLCPVSHISHPTSRLPKFPLTATGSTF